MSYDGGYAPQQQQRPYNGPAAPRPPPQRQYPGGPAPNGPGGPGGPDGPSGGQYGGYGGSDYGDGGYGGGSDYGGGYDDQGYGYGGPPPSGPQGGYGGPGRGGHPPMPAGRGGGRGMYPPRGGGPGPGPMRGGYQNTPGSLRPGPPDRANTSDPLMNHDQNGPPMNAMDSGFGGNAFPPFPGQQGQSDRYDEQKIMEGVAGMEISGNRQGPPPPGGPGGPGGRGGPPPMRGGPMGGPGYGPPRGPLQRAYTQQGGFADQGYGRPPTRQSRDENFGPLGRTMTMPTSMDPMGGRGPPPPQDGGPYRPYTGGGGLGPGGPGPGPGPGRGMMAPQRPSTAQGTRPPPQGMYPDGGGNLGYGNGFPGPEKGYDQPSSQQEDQDRRSSIEAFYDTYYELHRNGDYPNAPGEPQHRSQGSIGQGQYPDNNGGMGEPGPQRGASRVAEISRTKSQPDLRQSQEAVFEMAGDIPPMPSPRSGTFQQQGGLPSGPGPMRPGSRASGRAASINDSLPAHPTPVRPGLMPNSIGGQQLGNRPPPVRNYNGGPGGPMGPMSSGPGQNGPMSQQPLMQGQGPPPPNMPMANGQPPEPPVTPELLERLRNTVKADPNNQEASLTLAKKLVEAVDVLVPTLPDPRTRSKARERYAYDAHKLLKKLASQQNEDAMFFMADCLGRGTFGQEPDNKEAFTLYQSAAKLGHPAAAYRTAVCCEIGNEEGGGTRKDPLKAMQWYKRAATLGDTPAMYKVGMILLKGLLGQQRDPREAIGWLKRAAERADAENPHALHELGLLYESAQPNDVFIRDEAYAFQLFKQAADLGYKFSQFRLGCAYEYGLMGCPVDARLSIMWYSKSATQEEHQSELALSGWYLTGAEGVLQQSDTEAYLWARKAASAGLAKAEYAMGYFTEIGIGVAANLEDAKRWYWRAAAQDFPKARERLEDLKRSGKTGPRQRERISRNNRQQEGECSVM